MNITERNNIIIEKYLTGKIFTETIAKEFGISSRQVQRILYLAGKSKTNKERNKELAQYKNYSEKGLPKQITEYRKCVPQETRTYFLQANPSCSTCGICRGFGTRMEIVIKNLKRSPNDPTNLKTVCRKCILKYPAYLDLVNIE